MFFVFNLGKTDYDRYWESLTIEEKKRIIEEECDADERDFLREWDGTRYMKYLDQNREGLATFWYWTRVLVMSAFNLVVVVAYVSVICFLAYLMIEHAPTLHWNASWYFAKLMGLLGCGLFIMTIPAIGGLHVVISLIEWFKYKVKF